MPWIVDMLARVTLMVFLALLAPAKAETRQFANLIYDVPPGWEVIGTDAFGLRMFRADNIDQCEYCRLYLGTGVAGQWDLVSFLATQQFAFVEPEDRASVKVTQQPDVTEIAGHPVAMMSISADDDVFVIAAIALDDRTEVMAFVGPGYDTETLNDTLGTFAQELGPFIAGIRYQSEGATPLMPAPESGEVQGVWSGNSPQWTLGLDGQMRYELVRRTLVFFPNGLFYDGVPPQGTRGFDADVQRLTGDLHFGSYHVDGAELLLSFVDGTSEVMAVDGARIVQGELALSAVESLPDGATLSGITTSSFSSGFSPGSGVVGTVVSDRAVRYSADGKWESLATSAASTTFQSGTGDQTGGLSITGGDRIQSGTYHIENGLLVHVAAKGSAPATELIFREDGQIFIGDLVLTEN